MKNRKVNHKNLGVLAMLIMALVLVLFSLVSIVAPKTSTEATVSFKYEYHFYSDKAKDVLEQVRTSGAKTIICTEQDVVDYRDAMNEILRKYGRRDYGYEITNNDYLWSNSKINMLNENIVKDIEDAVSYGDKYMQIVNQMIKQDSKKCGDSVEDVFEYLGEKYSIDENGRLDSFTEKHSAKTSILIDYAKDVCKENKISFKSNDFGVFFKDGFKTFSELF